MRKENKKGITLIALVITIIVLLVLAGVSLTLVLGDNGVINKAQNATTETRDAEEKEKMEMAVAAARAAGNGTLTTDNLNSELGKFFANGMLGEETEQGWSYFIADKKYNIDKIGRVDKQTSLLPTEYQQVEYIESNGTQYIDLMLNASQHPNIIVEIGGNFTKIDNWPYIFGAGFHKDYNTNCSWILIGIDKSSFEFVTQNGISGKEKIIMAADTQKHIFIVDTVSNTGRIDQNSQTLDNNGVKPINFNYVLFALNNNGSIDRKASFKMNSCKIIDNDKCIRKYIPCYSTTTVTDVNGKQCPVNTKGLYDLVEGKFYTNKGSGDDFIAGPDV